MAQGLCGLGLRVGIKIDVHASVAGAVSLVVRVPVVPLVMPHMGMEECCTLF